MSEHAPESHGVRSEDDRVSALPIAAVGAGSLLVFFLASLATVSFLRLRQRENPPIPLPAELGQSKIGLVEQQIFELADRGERQRAAQRARLGSYGWVDRQAGVAHIPIDRAMELVAQGIRPMPAPRTPAQGLDREPGGQP